MAIIPINMYVTEYSSPFPLQLYVMHIKFAECVPHTDMKDLAKHVHGPSHVYLHFGSSAQMLSNVREQYLIVKYIVHS